MPVVRAVSAASRRDASSAVARQIPGPIVHQQPSTLEQVRAGVGGLDLVLDDMGERRLDDFPADGPSSGPPSRGSWIGNRVARRRPRGTGASSGTSTWLSTSHSASGTRAGRRRRASAWHRGPPGPGRRAEPGRASHVASRTSPDRAAVSSRNSNASLTAGCDDRRRRRRPDGGQVRGRLRRILQGPNLAARAEATRIATTGAAVHLIVCHPADSRRSMRRRARCW